jgi:hypothetical protein
MQWFASPRRHSILHDCLYVWCGSTLHFSIIAGPNNEIIVLYIYLNMQLSEQQKITARSSI